MEKNVFDQMAKRYDTRERIELANIIANEVSEHLENSQSKSLIDYGCGTGLVSLQLADLVKSVILVDSSRQMVEIVKVKIEQKGMTNAKVYCSDFTKEPPDLKADIILLSLVLLHIPNTKKILESLFNSLNNGGMLMIVDFDKNDQINHPNVHNGFSHEELKKSLVEVGFKSIKINTFYYGKRIFMDKDASLFLCKSMK